MKENSQFGMVFTKPKFNGSWGVSIRYHAINQDSMKHTI